VEREGGSRCWPAKLALDDDDPPAPGAGRARDHRLQRLRPALGSPRGAGAGAGPLNRPAGQGADRGDPRQPGPVRHGGNWRPPAWIRPAARSAATAATAATGSELTGSIGTRINTSMAAKPGAMTREDTMTDGAGAGPGRGPGRIQGGRHDPQGWAPGSPRRGRPSMPRWGPGLRRRRRTCTGRPRSCSTSWTGSLTCSPFEPRVQDRPATGSAGSRPRARGSPAAGPGSAMFRAGGLPPHAFAKPDDRAGPDAVPGVPAWAHEHYLDEIGELLRRGGPAGPGGDRRGTGQARTIEAASPPWRSGSPR